MAQITYQPQIPGATVGMPAGVHVQGPPQGYNALTEVLGIAQKAGLTTIKAVMDAEQTKQGQLADQALLDARNDMLRWQAEYNKTHQGQDALEAQRAYEAQWATITDSIRQRYPAFEGAALQKFNSRMEYGKLMALSDGLGYQLRQQERWYKSLDEGGLANLQAEIAANPNDTARAELSIKNYLEGLRQRHPGVDLTAQEQKVLDATHTQRVQALLAQGTPEGIAQAHALMESLKTPVVQGSGGSISAKYESGTQGINAIGYDPHGGTSYGKWQLSSRMGSYNEWLDIVAGKGEEGKQVAAALRAAGNPNTGGRKGKAVDAYLEQAKAHPQLFEETQKEYLFERKYKPMLAMLPAELQKQITSSPALQEMALSLANQHGEAGGAKILRSVYKEGISPEDLITGTYARRGGNFGSSPANVQASVNSRFQREVNDVLQILKAGPSSKNQDPWLIKEDVQPTAYAGLSPQTALALNAKIDSAARQIAVRQGLTAENFADHIAMGRDSGDFSAAERDIALAQSLGMAKELGVFQEQLQVAKTTYSLMDSMQDVPFVEMPGKIESAFSRILGPDNARSVVHDRDAIQKMVAARQDKFLKDPAAEAYRQPGMGELTEQGKIRAALAYQEKIGKGLAFAPKMLPKAQADAMKKAYRALGSADQRFDYINSIAQTYGEYAPGVMQEIGMGTGAIFMLPLFTGGTLSKEDAGILLTGMTHVPGDNPQVDAEFDKLEMKDSIVADSDLYAFVKDLSKMFPWLDAAARTKDDLLKGLSYYTMRKGENDFDSLNDAIDIETNGLAMLAMPKGGKYSASQIAEGINAYHMSPDMRKDLGITGPAKNDYERLIQESLMKNALYMMSADNKSVKIIYKGTGETIRKPDGGALTIPIERLMQINKERREKTATSTYMFGE